MTSSKLVDSCDFKHTFNKRPDRAEAVDGRDTACDPVRLCFALPELAAARATLYAVVYPVVGTALVVKYQK